MLLNISSITIKEKLVESISLSLRRKSLERCISASNNDSLFLTSGIFKYVFINENGVINASFENAIPKVCEKSNDKLMALIKVDLPPALGPVNIILFGLSPPILISLHTTFLLSLLKYGCQSLVKLISGLSLFSNLV